jgi:hypothetical protein
LNRFTTEEAITGNKKLRGNRGQNKAQGERGFRWIPDTAVISPQRRSPLLAVAKNFAFSGSKQ